MPAKLNFTLPRVVNSNLYLLILAAWFITLSFIVDNYWSANSGPKAVVKRLSEYVKSNQRDFAQTVSDGPTYNLFQQDSISELMLQSLMDKEYYLFVYKKTASGNYTLREWTSQYIQPTSGILYSADKTGFAQLVNGFYVWQKLDTANMTFISLLPVKWNYATTNGYLKNSFADKVYISDQFNIFPGASTEHNVKALDGSSLFYIKENPGRQTNDTVFSIILKTAALFFLFLFIHICATYIAVQKGFVKGVAFLVTVLVVFRLLNYFLPFPFNMRQIGMFDPTIYSSKFVSRSLGDLLMNAGLFAWVIVFIRFHLKEEERRLRIGKTQQKWILLLVCCLIIVAATFAAGAIIRSLISDSKISFDVINFFSLNIYTVIGFLVLCCVSIAFYFLCQTLLLLVRPFFSGFFAELYLGISVTGLLLLSFGLGSLAGGFAIYSLIWLLLFVFLLNNRYLDMLASRIVSSKLVFWIFFFSLSITIVVIFENNRKELRNRYKYAETLSSKTDVSNETMLNSIQNDFRPDFLAENFSRFLDSASSKKLKDSLIDNNFPGYQNKFETKIYSFGKEDNMLFNDNPFSYDQLNTILNTQTKPTAVRGFYYYDESFDKFNYISKKIITDTSGTKLGSIFVVVSPRTFKNEMLYPELFSKGKDNAIENSSLYAFAIYKNGKLMSSHNDYPFATRMPPVHFGGKEYKNVRGYNYDELWVNAGPDKYIVIVKENRFFIEFITLFSYLFCAFLLLAACLWLLTVFINSRLNLRKLRTYWQLTIRNQIHGVIIFISALSFLVIGTATIIFFVNRYESTNREKLSRVILIMKNQIDNSIKQGWRLSDTLSEQDRLNESTVEKAFQNIAEIHGVDVNIYDLNGDLKLSTLAYPYVKGILSTKMEPMAYQHLNKQMEAQYFQKEHISDLKFLSSYVPLTDDKGNAFAYLNIPYYTSQSNLQQEIANFLVTIINLNAFIFLIAGIVALFIATRITHSFSVIGEKMKKINLGTHNEVIEWNRKDEIGSLVEEYNKMVSKLDESAAALAKTEREGAWREMAKQVAHEIKNPLTPMKLSLQFLQRSIENNAPDVNELTTRVSHTLVEQIDHLSKIASDFSQFANIEKADKRRFDLNEQLDSIRRLYDTDSNVNIQWKLVEGPVWIFADKTHINRLFTNLILNAIQALPDGRTPEIEVEEVVRREHVLIRVKDNGDGIPESSQSKIFMPNFTTKSSGTGLGLAMSKRIVEQVQGSIWFETLEGDGTSFFVSIPLDTTH
ncbi:MAG: HAMP domain-containing sensor histidine kinase [Ferruginibacter sp.]